MKPHISLNLAVSADGKISDSKSRPSGWTSAADHSRLLALRQNKDALLVGRQTWLADHMTLLAPGSPHAPLRCVFTRQGNLPPHHPMLHTPGGTIHVLCTESLPTLAHPENIHFHTGTLDSFLTKLHESFGVLTLHCEGGGYLAHELLRIDAVDTVHMTIAGHTMFGGHTSPTLSGIPTTTYLPASTRLSLTSFEPHPTSGECFLTYQRIHQCAPSACSSP